MVRKIALATKHGKLAQIAPAFEQLQGWKVELVVIETDKYGTFSGEVPRVLSPKEAAIQKAREGALAGNLKYGLASEGTIGPHPQLPFINTDLELMAFVDLDRDITIIETLLSSQIQAYTAEVDQDTNFDELVNKLDLPFHAANIVIHNEKEAEYIKGIREPEELKSHIFEALKDSAVRVEVQNDFRAMNSPSRQANIQLLAEKLVARMASNCPACNEMGWGKTGFEYGVPCRDCNLMATSVANSEKLGCISCDFTQLVSLGRDYADPSQCDYCNP